MRLHFTDVHVADLLLVIGKDVMRLYFTKCAVSLTRCCIGKDVINYFPQHV
jgi:hypothetical protein